jgi:hypothetical protein
LLAGGTLEMAEVVGQKDLRGGFTGGVEFDVRWHRIDDPTLAHTPGKEKPDELGVFTQGESAGGSIFSRLEGCWFGNGLVYFDATDGGAAKAGQIWQYDPQTEKLKLLFESPNKPTPTRCYGSSAVQSWPTSQTPDSIGLWTVCGAPVSNLLPAR